MEELIKRLERVIQTGVPDKDGMHPISAEAVLEVVKSQLSTNLAEVGTDCISRRQAIEALERAKQNIRHNIERAIGRAICEILDEVENGIKQLPPIQSNLLQPWEVLVAQAVLPHPEIIRCRECKFASGDSRICIKFDHSPIGELDFCSFAERREVTT